jgi:lipoprotein-anchoring transpeptidase ErfK/SrfK
MRRTPVIAGAVIVAGVFALFGLFAYLYDRGQADVIAPGVRVAGVDVGGLRAEAAITRLRDGVAAPLGRPVVVTSGARRFTMSAQQAGVTVDTRRLVDAALSVSRTGSFVSRALRGLTGGRVTASIPLTIGYSHSAVRGLIAAISRQTNRPARDATVVPGAAGLSTVPAVSGVKVDAKALAGRIERALVNPRAPRMTTVPTRVIRPAVTESDLASRYPTYIVVDRGSFRLRFYERLQLAASYDIAVGRQGLETPAGLYSIQWKQVNPSWYVPNSSWAGALAGKVIPPGPQDPIKARWMGFAGGAGIHGIDPSEYGSIGHTASHGCVRMRIPDVIALYARVPVGTPVFVT